MAETNENAQNHPENKQPETLLIAHVVAHLLTGESFELYPFVDTSDVKAKVSDLIGGWASSGFLLRGARFYPWHQVRLLETTTVEEITRQEAQQRLLAWQADDQARAVQSFWKTKEDKSKKDDDKGKEEDKDGKKEEPAH